MLQPVLIVAASCYLIGGLPFGYILGRLNGKDIRDHGSGNIGATNCWRVCGRKWGLLCFLLDFLKGFVPVSVAAALYATGVPGEFVPLAAVFGTVAGHIWTPYLGFKGGKGIATSAGAVAAIAWLPVVAAVLIWAVIFLASGYVSLASIVAAAALPGAALAVNHLAPGSTLTVSGPTLKFLVLLATIAIVRHRSNIGRLLKGTESRFRRKEPTRS